MGNEITFVLIPQFAGENRHASKDAEDTPAAGEAATADEVSFLSPFILGDQLYVCYQMLTRFVCYLLTLLNSAYVPQSFYNQQKAATQIFSQCVQNKILP